jgi:hypothetical protein
MPLAWFPLRMTKGNVLQPHYITLSCQVSQKGYKETKKTVSFLTIKRLMIKYQFNGLPHTAIHLKQLQFYVDDKNKRKTVPETGQDQ